MLVVGRALLPGFPMFGKKAGAAGPVLPPFLLAVDEGHLFDMNKHAPPSLTTLVTEEGKNALHLAVIKGHVPAVEWLLERHMDVTCRTKKGSSALHFAVGGGQLAIAQLLVAKGADITQPDGNGRLPIHLAAMHGQLETLQWLVSQGASQRGESLPWRWRVT